MFKRALLILLEVARTTFFSYGHHARKAELAIQGMRLFAEKQNQRSTILDKRIDLLLSVIDKLRIRKQSLVDEGNKAAATADKLSTSLTEEDLALAAKIEGGK